ncbi:MAG TPA: type IV secretory system conjugative DNA transfer family protein, partial [Chloroflexota bacterium]|nr:type IV secretory system conjugative DNA transfer family protein [Chloroflexota bacterium]
YIVPLLRVEAFRRSVLAEVADPTIQRWWSTYYEPMDRRFQDEVHNPVLSKVNRFEGNTAARRVVGQAASTIDPARWLAEGSIVIVNTARGTLGENVAALLGGTVLNLVALFIANQERLASASRHGISLFVDEFHTIPGADYERILSELAKHGANLVLATQSMARLLDSGGERGRELRSTVFANLDGLFAFNCSAEDARFLVPELGSALDEQDLVELGEHQCYVRMASGGERLPTFSVSLDPPASGDPSLRERLAAQSAARFGRAAAEVDARIESAIARASHHPVVAPAAMPPRPRNEHRARKRHKTREVSARG